MLLALCRCFYDTFDLPQEENTEKNAFVTFSRAGIQTYLQSYLDEELGKVLSTQFQDIVFDVAGFSFALQTVRLIGFTSPKISIGLYEEQGTGSVLFSNAVAHATFEFSVTQSSYPYISDRGTGKIMLYVGGAYLLARVVQSASCPGAINVIPIERRLHVEALGVYFQSPMAFVYNAIMPILENVLLDLFSNELNEVIIDLLVQAMNDMFDSTPVVSSPHGRDPLGTDQRWIGDLQLLDRQISVASNGAACFYDAETSHCSGPKPLEASERCKMVLNSGVTFELNKNVFNMLLEHLWQLNGTHLERELGVGQLGVRVAEVTKSGLKVKVDYVLNNRSNTIVLLGKVNAKVQRWIVGSKVVACFRVHLEHLVDVGNETREKAEQIMQVVDPLLEDFAFTVINGLYMSFENAVFYYCDQNWVLVGADIVRFAQ